jgi:hypothetical protein
MHLLLSLPHFLRSMLLISLFLLPAALITGQENPPAPQFLYRNENHLALINGYTGETTELPFEVTDRDRFAWSPDGQYLLARLQEADKYTYCLNLYNVDAQEWVYNESLACAVGDVSFSSDGAQLLYVTIAENNSILWLRDLETELTQELYRTTGGSPNFEAGISDFDWSPTGKYLTFEDYRWIMGGTLNGFIVMNMENQTYITVSAPDIYYASYEPIWSADDSWFLIMLKEQYVTNGAVSRTNHRGDVYLISSETGEQYRLTYTPANYETDVRWTEDGGITFTVIIEEAFTYTIEEAMKVKVVPREEIVMPEPFDTDNYFNTGSSDIIVSPDPNHGAWVISIQGHDDNSIYELNFGSILGRTTEFSIPLPASYQYNNIIIGWRPSDYPYPFG